MVRQVAVTVFAPSIVKVISLPDADALPVQPTKTFLTPSVPSKPSASTSVGSMVAVAVAASSYHPPPFAVPYMELTVSRNCLLKLRVIVPSLGFGTPNRVVFRFRVLTESAFDGY